MEEELKRCPFCGGHATMLSERMLGETYYLVRCVVCHARRGFVTNTKEEAVSMWNERDDEK